MEILITALTLLTLLAAAILIGTRGRPFFFGTGRQPSRHMDQPRAAVLDRGIRFSGTGLRVFLLCLAGYAHRCGPTDSFQPSIARRRQSDRLPLLPPLRGTLRASRPAARGKMSLLSQLHHRQSPGDPQRTHVLQHQYAHTMGKSVLCTRACAVQPSASYQKGGCLRVMPRRRQRYGPT